MMKKLLFTLAFAAFSSASFSQVISVFPHVEDFESWVNCSTTAGAACPVPAPWLNAAGDNIDWTVDVNGTGSSGTGPTANGGADHNPGVAGGKYLYLESSATAGNPNAVAHLESPWFDFTALTTPIMSYWYHMFGTSQGTMQIDVRNTLAGGGPWTTIVAPYTDSVDIWQEQIVNLIAYAGQDSVQVRWHGITGTSFLSDMAIDDVMVFQPANVDLFAVSVDSIPAQGCGLGLSDVWTTIAQVGAVGLVFGDTLYASYNDGTTTINDTVVIVAPVGPAGIYNHMFSAQADYTVPGTYNITVQVKSPLDPNNLNDTTYAVVNSLPLVNTFPYLEDYESGNGGWIVGGANTSFELAVPNNAVINMSASDSMAYVTNATGSYSPNENGWVQGPCFDFTTLDSTAIISTKVWWESEFSWDGANITYSIDDGATWALAGNFGDPNNWYTDNTINSNPGGSQEGWTGRNGTGSNGWVQAHHPIPAATVGQSSVLLRINFGSDGSVQDEGFAFDDFQIGVPTPLDTTIADQVVCGDFTTFYGSTGTYEYASQDTATFIVTEIDTTLSGVQLFANPGFDTTFNLIVRFTDYLGCITLDTAQITLVGAPDATIEGDTTICFDGTALFTVATGANYAYLWSDLTTMDSAWYNVGGMVGVTVTDTLTGCSDTDSSLVSITMAVDIPMTTANVCGGDSLLVDAGTYDTYLWSTAETTQTIYVFTPGTYIVTATDTVVGCISMDSIVITTSLPVPAITGLVDTICANGSMILDAGAGFSSYSWTTSGSAQTETVLGSSLPLGDNTVTVTVTDGNGCSNTDAVTFNVDGCASLDDLDAIAMSIYPNPSTGEFTYSIENMTGDIDMMITDLSGKIIEAGKIKASTGIIDLTNYESGIYILKLQAGNAITSVRLLKQ